MIPGEALLDAFINANILICVAYLLWIVARETMRRLGLSQAYGLQLQLLNLGFLAVLCAPVLALLYHFVKQSGVLGTINLNLSDMVVSYYLNGGFEMKAADLEGWVHMRDTFTLDVINGAGWAAQAAIAAFAAGAIISLMRLVYSMSCLCRIVAQSYAWRNFGRIRIRLSDQTLVPFSTRGLRNYYVVIPSHMLSQSTELRVSLAHEFQHIRQGDLEWEIVMEALKPLLFLNPVYHTWKQQVEKLRELTCDTEVLARGRIDVKAYCDTLLSVCQTSLRRDRAFVIAVPKVTLVTADRSTGRLGKLSMLEHRIISALDHRPLRRKRLLFSLMALPLIVVMAVTTLAIQSPGDWSHDRLMLSTVANLERLDEINRLSTFGRVRN